MKQIKILVLILIVVFLWVGTAFPAIWLGAWDQNGNILNNAGHAGQIYNGSSCNADPAWVVYGHGVDYPAWHGCGTCWSIWAYEGAAGKLNYPKNLCGERYTFQDVFAAGAPLGNIVSEQWSTSQWDSNYMEHALAHYVNSNPEVDAHYVLKARLVTQKFFYDVNSGQYIQQSDETSWYPVTTPVSYFVPPLVSGKYIVDAKHQNYSGSIQQPLTELINNGGPYGHVRDELNPTTTNPTPDEYLKYYYYPGTEFSISSDLLQGLTPTFTPELRKDLFRTTYFIQTTSTMGVNPIPAGDGTEAKWMAVGWDSGSGRVAASGTVPNGSTVISLNGSTAATTIRLKYLKHLPTRVESLSTMPDWVRTAFENSYNVLSYDGSSAKVACSGANCTWYWLPVNSSTIIIPEKISRVVNGTEELWVLNKSALAASLPAWAAMSYDGTTGTYRIQQANQSAGFTYTISYNRLTVSVTGIDDLNHVKKLQGLPGFAPRPAANNSDNQVSSILNDMHLSAPNEIYAVDDGRQNTIRYVLTGWSGTGSVPESGTPDAGLVTTITPAITGESTLTWSYRKQIRVTVTTSGENDPLKVYDSPGDTSANSDTISNIAVTWTETVDDNGLTLDPPVTKSLMKGMLVWGYGIEAGTTIKDVSVGSNTITLSRPARFGLTQAAGQYLTFSTQQAYDLPGDTTNGSTVVTNINTTGLIAGVSVSGRGIQEGTKILSIDSPTRLTLTSIATVDLAGNPLAFGSVDARECQATGSFTPDVCATRSGVNFYSVDYSIVPSSPPTQVSAVTLAARNQFVEIENDADGNPQLRTRTLNQLDYPPSGVALTNVESTVGDRRVLMSSNLYKPMKVSWRYNATKMFTIGQPILPPTGRNDIDRETPPKITITPPTVDSVDTAFILSWDTATTEYQRTGNTTGGSTIISNMGSTAGLSEGMYVTGAGIPAMAKIVTVDSASQVTLSTPATQDGIAVALKIESRQGLRYFPIHQVASFKISWPIKNSSTTFDETGTTVWPAKQSFIFGAPANLQPPGAANTFNSMSLAPSGSTSAVVNGIFNPDRPGTHIIRFDTPKKAPDLQPGTAFIVVEAVQLKPEQYTAKDCYIGQKITNTGGHSDPENKNGFVYYPGAVHDGAGQNRAYDRETRTGVIIPVNESKPGEVSPLIVIWYSIGQGGIGWPTAPVRYNAVWPASPETISIGTGIPVSPTSKPRAMVYNQPDPSLPGCNPNEEHALITGDALYAMRNDLNGISNLSKPYVLVKYFDSAHQEWMMDVYGVVRPESFTYDVEAGHPIVAPLPASFQIPPISALKPGAPGQEWHLLDQKGGHWAKAANNDGTSSFIMQWYYYMRSDFYWPYQSGATIPTEGTPVPFLNDGPVNSNFRANAAPIDVSYVTHWPSTALVLPVGDTLTTARNGLPDLYNFMNAEVVFDGNLYNGAGPLAKLYAPERYLYAPLAALPSGIKTETGAGGGLTFPELPFAIQSRLFYDPINKRLGFKGVWISNEGEESWLLPNLMTATERDTIQGASSNAAWKSAVEGLYCLGRNPGNLDYHAGQIVNPFNQSLTYDLETWQVKWGIPLGLQIRNGTVAAARSITGEKNALTAGMAQGEGYVVIAENNSTDSALKDLPVALHVIRVTKVPIFQGVIKAIKSINVFDEKLTLHYTGDFGGEPERFTFEWYYQPVSGSMPSLPLSGTLPPHPPSDWDKFPDPGNTTGAGLTDITIQGASPLTMSDNWVVARYYYKNAWTGVAVASDPTDPATPHDDRNNWSPWSGANIYDTPMLAMGWVKRVIDGLNPLEARVTDFRNSATNTTVSMLSQFGGRYEGDVAFSNDPNYLNGLGLIAAYETVLNRARLFSIDAVPPQDYGPTNDALLNISSRLATFYMALGNEAYADAVDPTIGFSTKSAEYGNMAPSVFAFQNQVDSLLEEELALMRGRDDSAGSTKNAPYYNRLIWNFTQGEGEVAYAQNYNITDQDRSGVINAADAKIMYPQAHGDAWGHYLQAIKYYYKLLGHPHFSWEPRVEFVLVAGQPVMVDYLDERKFATIAAARAKTGAEIVDATYKELYTDDPAGQWQGYKDSYTSRAWGVDEWARRAGQGTYFDWVTANAILPDSVPATAHDRTKWVTDPVTGALKAETIPGAAIQQIDRSKVPELSSIASQFHKIQAKMIEVDNGVNPLGLVKGVVPFDIDPALLDSGFGFQGQTHFEQIYERAQKALDNAIAAYDYANGYTQRLRQNQDTLEEFKKNLTDQERDYRNRLIEIFGYPYGDDIGAGKTYPDGYDGPDLFHYNYVDLSVLTGKPNPGFTTYTREFTYKASFMTGLGNLPDADNPDASITHAITYNISTDNYWQVKDPRWALKRKAPGRIQQALSDLILAEASYNKGAIELNNLTGGISDAKDNLLKRYQVLLEEIKVRQNNENLMTALDLVNNGIHFLGLASNRIGSITREVASGIVEGIPKDITCWGGDALAPARGTVKTVGMAVGTIADIVTDVSDMGEFAINTLKERYQAAAELKLEISSANYEIWKLVQDMNAMIAEVDPKLLETYQLKETLQQTIGNYQAALAEGLRVWDERTEKRAQAAAEVQEYRFQDLGFRVFRNDAIQKYRAQFDLAAKYVYLAATAYDYETNLLGTASGAGRKFLSEIARQRTLGVISNAVPQAGFPGLADVMARLSQNFAVYKTQLGFNNPQTETTPFSLRTELFRVRSDASANADWRSVLKDHKVDDLWKIPEFKRFCRPFAPESAGAQPGIVIKFPTTITYGKNFFGWPLSGGDSAYSTSNFSTRVRSVGLWFQDYNSAGLSSTPRVYLVPTGSDVLRSPTGDGFATREWLVKDQKLPVPFPIGDTDLKNPDFIPDIDSLSDEYAGIRKVSDFRAYPYSGSFDPGQATTDSRLIGRSVWNTQWILIIPGSTLLFNKDVGLNTFIDSVSDIKMFFQTYAYSGN